MLILFEMENLDVCVSVSAIVIASYLCMISVAGSPLHDDAFHVFISRYLILFNPLIHAQIHSDSVGVRDV